MSDRRKHAAAKPDSRLRLEWVEAGSLTANPRNWRKHPDTQMAAIKGLIADPEVGWAGCLLFNSRTNRLIDGHARREAVDSKSLVPVLIGSWSEEAEKRILLTLDPIAGMAVADIAQLESLLSEVNLSDEWMVGLRGQLDRVLGDAQKALSEQDAATEIIEDDAPDLPANPITKPGDLWILGNHRLLCGDSTNPEHIDRLMNGERAALVATDPPYLVDYTGDRPNDSGKDWTDRYHEIDIKDADAFFRGAFSNVIRVLAPHAAIYCWHAHKRQALISRVWEALGILDHQQVIWIKPTAVFGRSYWHFQHEPCMMGWLKGSAPEHNGDHTISSVWSINWEGKNRIVGNEHPTQKPVEVFARPMRKHTRPGDICFEPFSGSGSQLIAAEQLGRRCLASEIEPAFVDVAVQRWERFTGSKAERARYNRAALDIGPARVLALRGRPSLPSIRPQGSSVVHLQQCRVLLCLLLGCGTTLGAEIFFTNRPAGSPHGIFRADLGSNEVQQLVPDIPNVSRIDTDTEGGRLYWTSLSHGLFSAALDGSDVRSIRTGTGTFSSVAFDRVHRQLYWSEQNGIFRSNPDGSNATLIATISPTALVQDLAIDPIRNKLYASDWAGTAALGSVRRMNLDGSAYETFVPNVSWGPTGLALETDAGRLYYARTGSDSLLGAIRSIPVTGGPDRLEVADIRPRDIELDLSHRHVYWNERLTTDNRGIRRADLDGGTNIITLPLGDITPAGIAFVPEPSVAVMLLLSMVTLRRIR